MITGRSDHAEFRFRQRSISSGSSAAVSDLSPFTHLPKLPGGELDWTPLIGLTSVTLLLCTLGLIGLRRRDVG